MEETLKMLRALADPTRLRIMLLLLEQELCVCELESVLGMEQSRISHALRTLHDAALIEERREGRWVFYRPAKYLPDSLLAYLKAALDNDPRALADRDKTTRLLEAEEPEGRRCPLRDQ